MTLNETVAAIAEALREKTGKSDLIAPVNFAEEIKGITSGGGSGESGGSNVEYLDLSGDFMLADILVGGIEEMKITVENAPFPVESLVGGIAVVTLADQLRRTGATVSIIAVSYNRDAATIMKQDGVVTTQTAYEVLVSKGESYVEAYNNTPRITKEQFYSLE